MPTKGDVLMANFRIMEIATSWASTSVTRLEIPQITIWPWVRNSSNFLLKSPRSLPTLLASRQAPKRSEEAKEIAEARGLGHCMVPLGGVKEVGWCWLMGTSFNVGIMSLPQGISESWLLMCHRCLKHLSVPSLRHFAPAPIPAPRSTPWQDTRSS